ncbi:hypothetical protein P9112_007356 [Eukaryota sp. TZLM1-RC]
MYTNQSLIGDASKHPLLPPNSLDLIRRLFDQLSSLIQSSLVQNQSIHVPRFGTFHVCHIKLDCGTIGTLSPRQLSFSLDPFFRRRHRFNQLRRPAADIKTPRNVNFTLLASRTGTTKEMASDVVKILVDSLSEAVSLNQKINISFLGVGKFLVKGHTPQFQFSPQLKKQVEQRQSATMSSTDPNHNPNSSLTANKKSVEVKLPTPSATSSATLTNQTPSIKSSTSARSSRVSSATLSQALSPVPSAKSSVAGSECLGRDMVEFCDCSSCSSVQETNIFARRPETPDYDPNVYRKALDEQLSMTKKQRRAEMMNKHESEKGIYDTVKEAEEKEKREKEQERLRKKQELIDKMRTDRLKSKKEGDEGYVEHYPLLDREPDPDDYRKQQFEKDQQLKTFQYNQWKEKQNLLKNERLKEQNDANMAFQKVNELGREIDSRKPAEERLTSDFLRSVLDSKAKKLESNDDQPDIAICARSITSSVAREKEREKARQLARFQLHQAEEKKKKQKEEQLKEELAQKRAIEDIKKQEEDEKNKYWTECAKRQKSRREELDLQLSLSGKLCPKCGKPKKSKNRMYHRCC